MITPEINNTRIRIETVDKWTVINNREFNFNTDPDEYGNEPDSTPLIEYTVSGPILYKIIRELTGYNVGNYWGDVVAPDGDLPEKGELV
jgi:hypothetical protein